MALFHYEALTVQGVPIRGEIEGTNSASVIGELQEAGYLPISAREVHYGDLSRWLHRDLFAARNVSARDLGLATQELATLLKAGMPLDQALAMLVEITEFKRLKQTLSAVLDLVRGGSSLGDAIARQDGVFPPLFINMVRAGEAGGALDVTLARLAEYLGKSEAVRDAVRSALVYPIILMVVAGLSLTLVMTVVLPQFEPLFREAGASLPLSTRIVMGLGTLVHECWWIAALAIGIGVIAFRRALERPSFVLRWHRLLLRMPFLSDLIVKIEVARFSRTLGALVANGTALPTALALAQETISNRVMAVAIAGIATRLKEGEGFSIPMAEAGIFPRLATHLMRVGEETGRLDEMLSNIADIFDRDVQKTTERFLAFLTPALTIGLGMTIAGIIASVLVALLGINDLVH